VSRRIAFVTILVAAMAAVVIATGCGGASKTAQAASPSPLWGGRDAFTPPPAWVMKFAAKQAVIGGDAHPAYAGWTLATVAEIAPALGERVSDIPASSRDKQMYLVVLHGNFTTLTFTHPMGYTQPPVIHWVQFELDRTTHGVVVWGWTHKGPPPSVEKLLHPFRL